MSQNTSPLKCIRKVFLEAPEGDECDLLSHIVGCKAIEQADLDWFLDLTSNQCNGFIIGIMRSLFFLLNTSPCTLSDYCRGAVVSSIYSQVLPQANYSCCPVGMR